MKPKLWIIFLSDMCSGGHQKFSTSEIILWLTWGSAVFSCLCSESLSWLTSCSLLWVRPRFSCVSLRVSRSRSLSSSMDTINDSKCPSESECRGEPEPRRLVPFPPLGPSASLMVGITSHIICKHREGEAAAQNRETHLREVQRGFF